MPLTLTAPGSEASFAWSRWRRRMTLPAPMLARSGSLPAGPGWSYELKWDGFRAIVRAGRDFRVTAGAAGKMTARIPELAALPVDAVLDGELVALRDDGWPDFPLVC